MRVNHNRHGYIIVVACLVLCSCGSVAKRLENKKVELERIKQSIDRIETRINKKTTKTVKISESNSKPKLVKREGLTREELIYDYIERHSSIAVQEMRLHHIPASIKLAQGILETGYGRSKLANMGNNHFGIKCHGWKGKSMRVDDDAPQECFRVYRSAKESYRDHSLFLTQRVRYVDLFDLDVRDYHGWAKGLKQAGYATNPNYANLLIQLIEEFDLDKFDQQSRVTKRKTKTNRVSRKVTHRVVKGDTLYAISNKYKVKVDDIKVLNKLLGNDIKVGQKLIIPIR